MRRALILTAAVAFIACQRQDEQPSTVVAAAKPDVAAASVATGDPTPASQRVEAPVRTSPKGAFRSWAEVVTLAPVPDRAYLEAIDQRYYGLLAYRSEQELRQLTKAGFPTPEEWLQAKNLSDLELEARANGGDIKAQLLYADRLVSKATTLKGGSDATPERTRALVMAEKYAAMALSQKGGGAFAAYLYGVASSERTGMPEYAFAGAMLAGDLGDARAVQASRRIQERVGKPADPVALHMIYSTMSHIADRRNQSRS